MHDCEVFIEVGPRNATRVVDLEQRTDRSGVRLIRVASAVSIAIARRGSRGISFAAANSAGVQMARSDNPDRADNFCRCPHLQCAQDAHDPHEHRGVKSGSMPTEGIAGGDL